MSKSIDSLIESFIGLPGIGTRSAHRLVFYLLAHNRSLGRLIAKHLATAMDDIRECAQCRNFTEKEICDICLDEGREKRLCVVELPIDILAIERSGCYRGYYFVLHGRLSPIDGIGPKQLFISQLANLVRANHYEEVIIATNLTVEGEVTAHYISKSLLPFDVRVTRIAHGVPMGGELEYVDGGTLSHAFTGRSLYQTDGAESKAGP